MESALRLFILGEEGHYHEWCEMQTEEGCGAVIGILLLLGKLNFKQLLPWAMVLANTYGDLPSSCKIAALESALRYLHWQAHSHDLYHAAHSRWASN